MGFNPGTGMTPNDWSEQEARRAERVQRADNPHGREMSPQSRRITGWILGLAALAHIVYAIFVGQHHRLILNPAHTAGCTNATKKPPREGRLRNGLRC